jgi:hypothetical protein
MSDKLEDIKLEQEAVADDWSLNPDQMFFMMEHHNLIMDAYANEATESLRKLALSSEYKSIFGEMSFDEAFDRYETSLEANSGEA